MGFADNGWLGVGHIALALLLSFDILLHKSRPVSAVLWLAVVWSVPLFGALGYVVFGIDRVRWVGGLDAAALTPAPPPAGDAAGPTAT
ncbi:MAG: PLD nuclease N-terminal domain-containing protein, partial [Gemmatimonadetes bacterium]|nr:PLD nuclease N-terminal domain-containing protein [Gemmatimonadota bacterium]